MAQVLFTPDPFLSPTHLSIRRGRATTTSGWPDGVVTTVVPSLGLCIGPAYEAGLTAGMRREHVSPQIRKKEKKEEH